MKGQASFLTTVLVALIGLGSSFGVANITANSEVNKGLSEVNTKTEINTANISSLKENTNARLDRIESKVDILLRDRGYTAWNVNNLLASSTPQ